jgi:hypothetical protein
MSSLLRPVGHLPAGVYWFRRGLLLAVLVALVVVLLRVFGGGEDPKQAATDVTSTPTPTPTTNPDSTTAPTPAQTTHTTQATPTAPTGPLRCAGSDVTVGVVPAARAIASGGTLNFGVVLAALDDSCTAPVDPTRLTVTIMSGQDRIWTSNHCQRAIARATGLLAKGKDFTSTVAWDGRRSGPGCLPGQPVAKPGTYTAQAIYDGRVSALQAFRINP